MHKIIRLLLIVMLTGQASAHSVRDKPGVTLRVGVWENPPAVLRDTDGQWRGIAVDTLRAIAAERHWRLVFVPAPFAEQLRNL